MLKTLRWLALLGVPSLFFGGVAPAAGAASDVSMADRSFVAAVSQGGMFEVAAGTFARSHGDAQNVRDQGNTEMDDHERVGAKLLSIASANGIPVVTVLNGRFSAEMHALTARSGTAFDNAFIADMKTIHAADGAAFAKESHAGSNPALRAFAAETYLIVQRHIGSLDAVGSEK